jgi:uncharacterized repeat protein (TIGR01451 family)
MRLGSLLVAGLGVVAVIALTVLGGAVTSQAATTQQVKSSINCEPATVKPGRTVGCTLTVTNEGGNNVTKVVVTDQAPGGTFLSTDDSRCTGLNTATLTCNIAKLASGEQFIETHELQVPSSGTSIVQTVTGRYSPNPNGRGSDTIPEITKTTTLDPSADYDGTFANSNGDSVGTGTAISGSNPYTTSATVNGTTFEVGLTVREHTPGPDDAQNCPPSGCLGNQVIEFSITELVDELPDTYTLIIRIAGEVVGNTKIEDLVVRHDGNVVPFDPTGTLTDPAGAFIFDRSKANSTKIATFIIKGPGDGNGGWGVG